MFGTGGPESIAEYWGPQIYTLITAYIYNYTCICIHIHAYTYTYIHIHTYTYVYIHEHTYTYILLPLLPLLFGIAFHLQLVLLSYHPIFLRPYHFLRLVCFLGANST